MVQDDYVRIQSGLKFNFDYRLSLVISIMNVVFFWSTVSPLLFPTAFLIFIVSYWKDKFFLIDNFYKRP